MCGRADAAFSLEGRQTLLDLFGPAPTWELDQAEIRPTDPLTIVTRSGDRYAVQPASWGLNLQGNGKRYATFNARVETLQQSRAFGEAFRQNGRAANASCGRCIVPLAAFYEWPKDESGQKAKVR
ncbi:MAG: SOS response-associated peptidase family protein, partial [Deinococcus sp.]